MANAEIMPLGMDDLPLVVDLYNEIFRPGREHHFFIHRMGSRHNPLILLAQIEKRPVGFVLGYEVKPSTYYCWYIGVLPDYRSGGVASQLMEALTAWARDNGYQLLRLLQSDRPECGLSGGSGGYTIVGDDGYSSV